MYIEFDGEEIASQFLVCDFYGVDTCFCWCANKLVTFPYTQDDDSRARNARVLSTPGAIRKIQCYDGRVFLICRPQGVYKLSRNGEFAILSKNALAMGAEYWEVIIAYRGGIRLDDKQTKSSRLLFHSSTVVPRTLEAVHALPLSLENTETRFVNCLVPNGGAERNLCVLAHDRKLFVQTRDTVQLVYTTDVAIVDIAPVKRDDKVAGLLLHLLEMDTVILVHGKDCNLVFEKVYLGRNARDTVALCAGFSLRTDNVVWILYCDQSRLHYVRKQLFAELVQQTRVDERTFRCMQHYRADVILGLSRKNQLVKFSMETPQSSVSVSTDVGLCANMFQKTDLVMEKICAKVQQLNALYKDLADEQDRLRRINLYASKQKLKVNPHVEVSRLCNYRYLTLSISDKLPKNSHVAFTFVSGNRNTFCIKEVSDTLAIKMPINDNDTLCSLTVSMDLITLMDKEHPWCLIRNFVNCPSQDIKRKKGRSKQDKTVFIDTKIMSLRKLMENQDLSMTKLHEMKKVIRAEL